MDDREPQTGDRVLLYGTIRNIIGGVALVEVFRSYPPGGTVSVQCGVLELDSYEPDPETMLRPAEEDETLEQIKAAWNHSVAWNFDTPGKAEAHIHDPDNPTCQAYLEALRENS